MAVTVVAILTIIGAFQIIEGESKRAFGFAYSSTRSQTC